MKDIMIDIETLGNESDTVVTSFGAVEFDTVNGVLGKQFYTKFKIQDQLDKGRKITESTLLWWLTQDIKVFRESLTGPIDPTKSNHDILVDIGLFCSGSGVSVWGNGSNFDITIMESLFKTYGLPTPWSFMGVTDLRTFKRFTGNKFMKKKETAHSAIGDAVNQANYVLEVLKK